MFLDSLLNRGSNKQYQYAKMMNGYTPIFSQFGENIYASDVVQNCINVIATEISKLMPRHIRTFKNNMRVTPSSSLNRLLKFSPNEIMTTRDFLEKIIWTLYFDENVFIYPEYTTYEDAKGNLNRAYTAFYPLKPIQVDFIQDITKTLFIKLYFGNGEDYILPYADVIHIRRKFSVNDFMGGGFNGQPDNQAILKVLETNDTVLQGVGKAVKASLAIRGILKINTMLEDTKQQAERTKFENALATNESGILPLDLKGDYTPININPKIIDPGILKFLQDKILDNYGVSLPIFSGDFTDEQYQAFYEKTLEPLIISLGQAFSKTIFTANELNFGNEIVFYPQKLLFTNVKNKIAVADILGNRGALTNNELLDLFGYPPYDGGDERFMSLNYIDNKISNEYQLKKAGVQDNGAGGNDNGQK